MKTLDFLRKEIKKSKDINAILKQRYLNQIQDIELKLLSKIIQIPDALLALDEIAKKAGFYKKKNIT